MYNGNINSLIVKLLSLWRVLHQDSVDIKATETEKVGKLTDAKL